MLIYQGKSVYGGIAMGKIRIWQKKSTDVMRMSIEDTESEYNRFLSAKDEAVSQLSELYEKALDEVGADNAAIFEIHIMLLSDDDYLESIQNFINTQKLNAEYAVYASGENFSNIFSSMDDPYMQARAADIKDITCRLLDVLSGNKKTLTLDDDNIILVADELSPSETVQLDKTKIAAFVTAKGSLNSHTAILARTMNIPAIIGTDIFTNNYADGKDAIVDGYSGTVYVEPDEDLTARMQHKLFQDKEKKRLLQELKGKNNVTLCGQKINLFANIGNIKDLATVLENDAGGIGLFRSEFIFLEKNTFPSEEEQFAIYKNAVETMAGKKVIIRTLDIGADKKVDYFNLKDEENPALGVRGIRLCLKRPEIFKTQLRALMRAAVFGNLSIMYPMISSVGELLRVKEIVQRTAQELEKEGIPYSIPEQGIMIETPSSVILSDKLAKEVSFFSIGTNDLTQYTTAMDRQNSMLDEFIDATNEAVLKMIETTAINAHNAGIWVGICGELAADLSLTETFLKMGIDELSVSPAMVLHLRKKIRETKIK